MEEAIGGKWLKWENMEERIKWEIAGEEEVVIGDDGGRTSKCAWRQARHMYHVSTPIEIRQRMSNTGWGGALNRGLLFADLPQSLLGAVSGNISEIR